MLFDQRWRTPRSALVVRSPTTVSDPSPGAAHTASTPYRLPETRSCLVGPTTRPVSPSPHLPTTAQSMMALTTPSSPVRGSNSPLPVSPVEPSNVRRSRSFTTAVPPISHQQIAPQENGKPVALHVLCQYCMVLINGCFHDFVPVVSCFHNCMKRCIYVFCIHNA